MELCKKGGSSSQLKSKCGQPSRPSHQPESQNLNNLELFTTANISSILIGHHHQATIIHERRIHHKASGRQSCWAAQSPARYRPSNLVCPVDATPDRPYKRSRCALSIKWKLAVPDRKRWVFEYNPHPNFEAPNPSMTSLHVDTKNMIEEKSALIYNP